MQALFPVPPEHDFWIRCVFARDWVCLSEEEKGELALLGWDPKGEQWNKVGRGYTGKFWCKFKIWNQVLPHYREQWKQLGFTEALWNCFAHPHRGFDAALRRRNIGRCVFDGVDHFVLPRPGSSSQEARPSYEALERRVCEALGAWARSYGSDASRATA